MAVTSMIVVSSVLSMLSFIDQSMSEPMGRRAGHAQLQSGGKVRFLWICRTLA